MATWTQNGDTHTATINGYRVTVTKSEQFGSYGYMISTGHHIVRAGDKRDLEAAKLQAEREATELEQA